MTGRMLTVLLAFVLASSCAFAQQTMGDYSDVAEMPGGTEGNRIDMLFQAANTGDLESAKQFYQESFSESMQEELPLDAFLGFFSSFVSQTGGIEFHSIREYTESQDDQTVIVFQDRNYGSWKAFVFYYEPGQKPDGKLVGFTISPARTPSDVEPPGILDETKLAEEIAAFVEPLCDKDLFSGTVLVANGEEIIYEYACGEASKRFHAPVNMDTKFNLGSMNKMFTSTAVMQLMEKGILNVDDPIGKYVDETWLPRHITDEVTIHNLLTHTSGLGDYFNETFEQGSRLRWRELDDYKELIYTDTLAFTPGTDWEYSNAGMFMLGVVIENATGQNYFDYIRDNIYAPAGMEDTDCYDMDCPIENLAIGYWRSPDCPVGWKNNYYEHVVRGGPAGGGFSTSPDLWRFALALEGGKLVSEASRELMWTDHYDAGYGYGFGIQDGPAGKVVGHGGGFTGINSHLDLYLDSGYVVAVMSNYDSAATPIRQKIVELIGRVE
ncbi:MAG: serine hydrolase [Candidatus Eisenbacteria bacterium]|nr:serine hydrolase [Candidatus Eisenbacteria bacterium]